MKSIQTFLESFNCIPFEEKPQILFQTWEFFFAIQCSQPEDSNELYQKLLKDLKELAEYDQSTSTDHPIFLNDNEDHPVQNRESSENSSEENVVSKTNQEPPQDSDIHQLIEEFPNPAIVSVEEENVVHREEEGVDLENISQVQDIVLREKLFSITCLISNIESLNDNSTPDCVFNSFDFEDIPLIPRPPPEPPDDNFDLEPEVISAVMEDIDEPDEHFNPGGEIFVSTNNEDVDYFPFMFVIRIFLPYLIIPDISLLLPSAESEDTIFDPGLSLRD
nr:hypothetical protein [Tanacetum cinerariifolium]